MSFKVISGNDIDISFMSYVMEIDRAVYHDGMQGVIENLETRFKVVPDSFIIVKYVNDINGGESLAGYINLFPISESLKQDIRVRFRDDDIGIITDSMTPEEQKIRRNEIHDFTKDAPNDLFILSAAIKPTFQNTEASSILSKAFVDYLKRKQKEGYPIRSIYATAVSPDGIKFLSTHRFHEECLIPPMSSGEEPYHLFSIYNTNKRRDLYYLMKNGYKKDYKCDVHLFFPYTVHHMDLSTYNFPKSKLNPADFVYDLFDAEEDLCLVDGKESSDDKDEKTIYSLNARKASEMRPYGEELSDYEIAKYLDEMHNNSVYECKSAVAKNIKRIYAGKIYLLVSNDVYPDYEDDPVDIENVLGIIPAYLYISFHYDTGLAILNMMIPEINTKEIFVTQIEDMVHTGNIRICVTKSNDPSDYISINRYMKLNFNLDNCGDAKCMISLNRKPDQEELEYMLSGEVRESTKIDYKLVAPFIKEAATKNIGQYNYYEAYVSSSVVVFVDKKEEYSSFLDRIDTSVTYLFVLELVDFQNSAITRMNRKITEYLGESDIINFKHISQLYQGFGRTIPFWDTDNFKYKLAQEEADQIREGFHCTDALNTYYQNQDFLEHIVELNSTRSDNIENRMLGIIATVLAIFQVVPLFDDYFFVPLVQVLHLDENLSTLAGVITSVSGVMLIILIWTIFRRTIRKAKTIRQMRLKSKKFR